MFKIIGNGSFAKALSSVIIKANGIVSDQDYEWVILSVPSYAIPKVEFDTTKKVLFVSKGMVVTSDTKANDTNPNDVKTNNVKPKDNTNNGIGDDGIYANSMNVNSINELVTEWAERNNLNYAFLAGPHLASELQHGLPSMSTIASHDKDHFYQLEDYFPGPSYLNNPHLVALSGVIKNIIAYGCGMYAALELGQNMMSCVVSNGVKELVNIANHMQIKCAPIDIVEPGILPDMILTGTSRNSRNFSSGYNRIKGIHTDHLTESQHSAISLIKRIGYSPKWPIISLVASVIDGDLSSTGDLMQTWKECCENRIVNFIL